MKYLIYATGEILLVVIGILLALQINNWNEDQKEKKVELKTLQDLQVEFVENLRDAERVYTGNMGVYLATAELQQQVVREDFDQKAIDSLLFYMFDWFDYTPKPGASNNLINAGNLNLISHEKLRNLLTLWPGVNAELEDDEQLAIGYSQNTIVPFMAEHYPVKNLERFDQEMTHYLSQGILTQERYLAKPVPYEIHPLLDNPVFQSHISVKKMYARHNAMECLVVINTCKEILEIIEQELKQNSR